MTGDGIDSPILLRWIMGRFQAGEKRVRIYTSEPAKLHARLYQCSFRRKYLWTYAESNDSIYITNSLATEARQ